MEFRFDVGSILLDEISKVDNSLIIKGWNSKTRFRVEYQQLYEIVNTIGEASSFAQGLSNVITTAEKIQNGDHTLYLMKEDDAHRHSVVVGLLKIGRKKLFLQDLDQKTREVAPLCVLDFYIHESRQRRGYGRRLFDYMLMDHGIQAGHMAVDKPSDKFLGFLEKHYHLTSKVPQINNFVVYDSFFEERPVSQEEQQMTTVNRSRGGSRAGSRTGSRAGSRPGSRGGSPELPSTPTSTSPSTTRRLSTTANTSSSPAGRPTYGPRHSSICVSNGIQFATFHPTYSTTVVPTSPRYNQADILHGRVDRHTAAAHKNPRYQPTLDWMKTEGGESPLYSRTPSQGGSPMARTPMGASPPATPLNRINDTRLSAEGSIAPTPATSPNRGGSPALPEALEEEEGEDVVNGEETEVNGEAKPGQDEAAEVVDGVRGMSVASSPPKSPVELGKTGSWRDSISRNSENAINHLSTPGVGGTSAGVLKDDDSVHGHLKFHHHKLW